MRGRYKDRGAHSAHSRASAVEPNDCRGSNGAATSRRVCTMQLTVVLTLLAAAYQTGHGDEACPSQCIRTFAMPTDNGVRWIRGPAASGVAEIIQVIADSRPSSPTQQVTIKNEKVLVPTKVKPKVVRLLKAHPELSLLLLEILNAMNGTPHKPQEEDNYETFGEYEKDLLSPTNDRVKHRIPVKPLDSKRTPTSRPRLNPSRPKGMKSFVSWDDKPRKHLGSKNTGPAGTPDSTATGPDISERFGNEHVDEHGTESGEAVSPVYSSPGEDTSTSKGPVEFHFMPEIISNKSPLLQTNKFRFTTTTDSSPGGDEPWHSATAAPVYSSLGEDTSTSKGLVKVHATTHSTSTSSEEDEPWASEDSHSTSEPTGNAQVLEIPGLVEASSKDEAVPEDVLEYLDFLQKNPSLFVPVYKILVKKGVKFPDLRKPIRHIIYNGTRIRLPKKVIAAYPVKINERLFTLPKDAKKFARFVSENPEELPAVVTAIQQLGGTVTPDRAGKLKGFKLFEKTTTFPTPLTPKVEINGRTFKLPKDIKMLIVALKNNPGKFYQILPLLEMYGAHPEKSPSGEINSITISGKRLPVHSVRPVRVTLGDRVYNIPADLEEIVQQPGIQSVGELMRALQESKVRVVVERDSGKVVGIDKDGVRIPFPVAIQLVLKMGRRKFVIPRDLSSVIRHLELHGLPSDALNVLYDFGVIPVRNADHVVTAIEFNGQRYPVKQQPRTSITVARNNLSLPGDSDKLVRLTSEGKISISEFLRVIQRAGYRLLPGADGELRSAHKGFEVIKLPKVIRLMLTINNINYSIPHDLPRLAKLLETIQDGRAVEKILDSLGHLGVDVRRSPDRVTMSFNGKNYNLPLKPGRTNDAPYDAQGTVILVNFNGRSFTLPKDAADLAKTVRSQGPSAITLLANMLRADGVEVNLTPSGDDIVSFEFRGKKISVSGRIAVDAPVVSVARSSPEGRGADEGGTLRVTIRGKVFTMPDDFARLKEVLPNFQHGELVRALDKAGAKLLARQEEFYAMRLKGGTVVHFPETFRLGVEADGKKFWLPEQLPQLAKTLSSCKWVWTSVRERLADVGVELRYGSQGAPSAISFQGQSFRLHGTPTA